MRLLTGSRRPCCLLPDTHPFHLQETAKYVGEAGGFQTSCASSFRNSLDFAHTTPLAAKAIRVRIEFIICGNDDISVRFRTLLVTASPQTLFGPSAPRLFGRSGLAPCQCADNGDCQPESCFLSPQQSPLSFRHADHGRHEIHRSFALRYRNKL